MIGVATIVVDQDCNNCGWSYNNWFFATIVASVATIVVDCDNCDHMRVWLNYRQVFLFLGMLWLSKVFFGWQVWVEPRVNPLQPLQVVSWQGLTRKPNPIEYKSSNVKFMSTVWFNLTVQMYVCAKPVWWLSSEKEDSLYQLKTAQMPIPNLIFSALSIHSDKKISPELQFISLRLFPISDFRPYQ